MASTNFSIKIYHRYVCNVCSMFSNHFWKKHHLLHLPFTIILQKLHAKNNDYDLRQITEGLCILVISSLAIYFTRRFHAATWFSSLIVGHRNFANKC